LSAASTASFRTAVMRTLMETDPSPRASSATRQALSEWEQMDRTRQVQAIQAIVERISYDGTARQISAAIGNEARSCPMVEAESTRCFDRQNFAPY
jgi:hypothetical protein